MDEADVRQRARAFVARVDVSNIREDLSPYVTAANAKVKKDEHSDGESGYTEPPRILRRLFSLRGLSHEQEVEPVFT